MTRAGDFGVVAGLLEEMGRPKVGPQEEDACRALYEDQLGSLSTHHLVAEDDDGRVVGFCSLHFRPQLNYVREQAWVPDLIVRADARRRGVARALLEEVDILARARGCNVVTLESGHDRVEAHALYRALGMVDTGLVFGKALRPSPR